MTDYDIPVLIQSSKKDEEVCATIDEFILDCLETYRIFKINSTHIYFNDDEVFYKYEPGEILEAVVPSKDCACHGIILPPPEKLKLIEDRISLHISFSKDGNLCLDDDCGKMLTLKKVFSFHKKNIDPIIFNSFYVLEVLKNYPNEFCKVYMNEDYPLCFEFINKRVFVSPIT